MHYICRLKEGSLPFEIQMRTALQHVWSAVEHDIGYKGFVKLPPEFRRQFSRLAGMLELVDDEFSRLRTTMSEYRRQVQTLVKSGHLDEVPLTTDSFRSQVMLAREGEKVMVESGGITWLYNPEYYPFPTAVRRIREAADLVGWERLMWGSDYPRTITAITYRMSYDFIEKSSELTADEKRLFLGENAQRFYGFQHLPDLPYIKNMSE